MESSNSEGRRGGSGARRQRGWPSVEEAPPSGDGKGGGAKERDRRER